jgi:muramoyltetrapeptide carboxypeptidase
LIDYRLICVLQFPCTMEILLPPRIKKGGVVTIIAPGSPVRDLVALQQGIEALEDEGFEVEKSDYLCGRQLFYAGEDDVRAKEVNRAFADGSVAAIFCARGGAGSIRVLPFLDYEAISRSPKIFVGYSDTTALQLALLKRCGLVSFYGPMVETDLGKRSSARRRGKLWSLLRGEETALEPQCSRRDEVLTLYPGEASGRLVGGCLSIFASLMGTPYEPDTRDAILFLEDIDESSHRIDRYLTQLLLAGKLAAIRGLIFGSFPRSSYPPDHEYHDFHVPLIDIIQDRVLGLKVPCIFGLPFGHVRDPYTIPLGGHGHLDATKRRLVVEVSVA